MSDDPGNPGPQPTDRIIPPGELDPEPIHPIKDEERAQAVVGSMAEHMPDDQKPGIRGIDPTHPLHGGSFHTGLEPVPDSFAPLTARGEQVQHVRGPGQSPVDPYAAGLQMHTKVTSSNENRMITLTGPDASGPAPATHQHSDVVAPRAATTGHAPAPRDPRPPE